MNTDLLGALAGLVTVSPPPLLGDRPPLDPGWKADEKLQNDLEAVEEEALKERPTESLLKEHALAVVDLTDDPDNPDKEIAAFNLLTPAYAGARDTEQRYVASLAKLLALYGAYSLRADLVDLTTALNVSDLGTAAAEIRKNYRRIKAATATRPNVEKMFAPPSAPGDMNFTRSAKTDSALDMLYHNLKFDPNFTSLMVRETVRLMAGWSENIAASDVIRGLGFHYLWALTNKAGLFRRTWDLLTREDRLTGPSGPGGLLLTQDFQGKVWEESEGRPRNVPPPSNQAATARSVAMLLTSLAQDKLVRGYASNVAMREMLRKRNPDFTSNAPVGRPKHMEYSPIGVGMTEAGWSATQKEWNEDQTPVAPPTDPKADIAASKIGLIEAGSSNPGKISNGLIVRTTRSGITITAVLVGMNKLNDKPKDLEDFGRLMAGKLAARHGVS